MNRKIFFYILVGIIIIVGAFFVYSTIAGKSQIPPKLVFSEEEWDFGQIEANAKPSHTFILTNKGGKVLYIDRVRASCGCIVSSLSTNKILPGKSAELSVNFNAKGYEDIVRKALFIESNDEKEPTKKINIIAKVGHLVKPKIKFSPEKWNLGFISEGDISTYKGEIQNIGDADLIIDELLSFDNIKCNIATPFTIKPNEKQELIFTYGSTGHKLGEVKEAIRFNTNDSKNKTLYITISGYINKKISSGISASPGELTVNWNSVSQNGEDESVILENLGDRELNIVSISSSVNYISPQYSNLKLKSKAEEELPVIVLKEKAREVVGEGEATEYIYITIALPVKISK